jgi:N-acetylmuramoyl-L-alanine amidase
VSRSKLAKSWVPSPNVESRKGGVAPHILLLHYTGMKSTEAALNWLCDPRSKVSCHYLVDEGGRITQMVDEDVRAWHAGIAIWKGERDINSSSIGIEIHNPGHTMGYPDFPPVQMDAVMALCADIVERRLIRPECVLAHSDVAPKRKADPGEKFSWRTLHARGIGHWIEPVPIGEDSGLRAGDSGEEVRELQSMLALYGYGLDVSAQYDSTTEAAARAFQRHFRQRRVDGVADFSTIETLRRLISALPDRH